MRRVPLLLYVATLVGCGFHPTGLAAEDGGSTDGQTVDATDPGDGRDSPDAGELDAPELDAPELDAPAIDATAIDAQPIDAIAIDAPPIDAPPPVGVVVHVPDDQEAIGTGDMTISATLTINTSGTPSANMALPPGVTLSVIAQDGGGSDLAVLRARALTISAGVVVRATGSRPLVILAETVTIAGWLEVSASGSTPGPGAFTDGGGVGTLGGHVSTFSDGGGGGGSFGSTGGAGGDAPCDNDCTPDQIAQGGDPGAVYGAAALTRLEGGSPGGRSYFPAPPTACTAGNPGAGGGALQIYARTSITIAGGGIAAGGGGGSGGFRCGAPSNWLAGHGGGSGGAIYLQSPSVQNTGTLVANGGGGGGGAGQNGNGANGGNANRGTGTGGNGNGNYAADGGDGASQGTAPQNGFDGPDQGNGGGGGGGLGRIHVRSVAASVLGNTSPTATTSTY